MDNFFVDRIELKQELFDLLNDAQSCNTVYILSSRSGLGKSAFSQQVINYIKTKYPAIKISIPIGENISIDEGFYIREMAKAISGNANKFNYESMNDFLKTTTNPIIKKIWNHKLISDAESLSGWIRPLNSILSYFDKIGDFSENGLLGIENQTYTYLIQKIYITEICKSQSKFIINIENIQQIDKVSLMQIKDILKETRNIFFLFEYTSCNDSLDEAKRFGQYFSMDCTRLIIKKLKKLDYEYTCELFRHICSNQKQFISDDILKEVYFTIDGNIRQLSDIEYIYELSDNTEKINTSENFTLQRLESLNNAHQIQLLCLVYTHMSQVENKKLKLLINQKDYMLFIKYEDILSELTGDNGLLEGDDLFNLIRLQHDSIRDIIKKISRYEPKIALSYSWWIEFYENELHTTISNNRNNLKEIIKKLCYFYCHYEPSTYKIIKILPYIRIIVLNSVNPDEAISFLLGVYDTFKFIQNNEYTYKLEHFLLKTYYELGIFDKAYNIYENMTFHSNKIKMLYKIMLLERMQNEDEAIKIINTEFSNTTDEHYGLLLLLIKMIANASINRYNNCIDIFNDIHINRQKYSKYYEYGFFLRNSEIILGLKEAIPYLNESITFFKKRNKKIYEAHSRISLVMNYSRLGMFKEAKEQLDIAKKLLQHNSFERHILLNDEVAYEMCHGNYDKELENELKLAMCTAETIFDKIVINHNLLILYKKNNQQIEGNQIVDYLLELVDSETNRLNICFTYWNISYFYKDYNNDLYTYYYNKYLELYKILTNGPIRKSVIETNVYHKPNNEYVIEFISYWHFPLPDDL